MNQKHNIKFDFPILFFSPISLCDFSTTLKLL